MLSMSLLRYMVDFRISSGRLFHVDAAIYRKRPYMAMLFSVNG